MMSCALYGHRSAINCAHTGHTKIEKSLLVLLQRGLFANHAADQSCQRLVQRLILSIVSVSFHSFIFVGQNDKEEYVQRNTTAHKAGADSRSYIRCSLS